MLALQFHDLLIEVDGEPVAILQGITLDGCRCRFFMPGRVVVTRMDLLPAGRVREILAKLGLAAHFADEFFHQYL